MPANPRGSLYRVVATRNDGTTIVLASNLTRDRAQAIIDALGGVSAFKAMEFEREPAQNPVANLTNDDSD
jgi:hypothetical protein